MNSVPHTEQLSVSPERFFDHSRETLNDLFTTLEVGEQWDGSLESAVELTQPWVKGDHGLDSYPFNLSDEQQAQLKPLYDKLGMTQRRDLPVGHYDQILVLGAVHYGNDRRLRFLSDSMDEGVTADRIILMGGERKIDQREPVDVARSITNILKKDEKNEWLESLLQKPQGEVDETDMLRIAAMDHLGPLVLSRLHFEVSPEARTKTSTPVRRYDFNLNGTEVNLMHTRAVRRKDGLDRHTTEACIQDWLETFTPDPSMRIGFIGAQPHLDRMVRSAERVVASSGQAIHFIAGGPEVGSASDTIYLGEVARSLYEDLQLRR